VKIGCPIGHTGRKEKKMKKRHWIEIREKGTKELIRIVYNPYGQKTMDVIKLFIPEENLKFVYGVRTN